MAARLKQMREALGLSFEIVGVGGVNDAAAYAAYRTAGADAVMSATGAMWNPRLAQQISARLVGQPGEDADSYEMTNKKFAVSA
jgi:dihydroorotate dehydrogenase (NAD+) catalytic subunit